MINNDITKNGTVLISIANLNMLNVVKRLINIEITKNGTVLISNLNMLNVVKRLLV